VTTPDTPIVVNPNPVPQQAWVAIRDVLKVLGGYLVGRGLLDAQTLEILLGAFLVIGPMVWAQLRTRRQTAQLTVVADAAPNRVAVVKEPVP
jgi:hypothetical protein